MQCALSVVSEFDGTKEFLFEIFDNCDESIRTKMKGEARKSIIGHFVTTLNALKIFSRKLFPHFESGPQLYGKLSKTFQKDDETVFTYANRIKGFMILILEVEIANLGFIIHDFKENLKRNVIESFK